MDTYHAYHGHVNSNINAKSEERGTLDLYFNCTSTKFEDVIEAVSLVPTANILNQWREKFR